MLLTPLSFYRQLFVRFPGICKRNLLGIQTNSQRYISKKYILEIKVWKPTNQPTVYRCQRSSLCYDTSILWKPLFPAKLYSHLLNICKVKQSKQSVVGIKCAEIFMLTTYFMLTTLQPHMFQAIRSILPDSRNQRCIPTLKMDQPLFIAFVSFNLDHVRRGAYRFDVREEGWCIWFETQTLRGGSMHMVWVNPCCRPLRLWCRLRWCAALWKNFTCHTVPGSRRAGLVVRCHTSVVPH